MLIITPCSECDDRISFDVESFHWREWMHGKPVNEAFPELSINNREFLQTQICIECRNKLFGKGKLFNAPKTNN